jgi:hypothetical protein
MEEEGLGGKFWLGLFGVIVLIGIGGLVLLAVMSAAWYAWGAFGALLVVFAPLLVIALVKDRRDKRLA